MSKPSNCKKCEGRIWWVWGQGGKYPINSDGAKHWPTCRKPYTGPLVVFRGKTVGEDYRPFDCTCGQLPWSCTCYAASKETPV